MYFLKCNTMNSKWVYSIKHTQNLTEKKAQLQIITLAKLRMRKEKNRQSILEIDVTLNHDAQSQSGKKDWKNPE